MSVRRASQALALLPVLLLVAALPGCASSGPAIQEVSPAKGEGNVAGDAPIRVVFNRDVDRASVESRLKIQPAIEGCDHTTCPVRWNGRTMIMRHPQHQFAASTRYQVNIASGYRDSAGQVAGLDHFWDFTTEGAPRIVSVSPADRAAGVAVDADIVVQFSRSVLLPPPPELTLTAADDPEPVSYRLGIAPGDTRRLVMSPLLPLRPRLGYTVHVGPGVMDVHHNPIQTATDFHFTTGALDLSRNLAFLVRDEAGATFSRVAELRPPAGVNAPAPSLRVLYTASHPILSFAWASDSTALYVLDTTGGLIAAPLDGTPARAIAGGVVAEAANPVRDEVAYVSQAGELHLARRSAPSAVADVAVGQAGQVRGTPAWSGDGRRVAFAAEGPGGRQLRLLDRETLSVSDVPGVTLAGEGTVLAWSFDGTALAFTRPAVSGQEAWTYRPLAAQGGGLARLGPVETTSLSWSSDGGTVFAAGVAPGSEQPLLERAPAQPVDGQPAGFTVIKGTQPGDSQPVAPGFDRRVAFIRQAAGTAQLWIMNNDGTGVSQLTFATYSQDERLPAFGVGMPRWAPGGPGG
ncbi:MAG: Ig-like domain-containing protein [Candidatus Dormibacteraeota bacterium]|nr:Ig-like domain-containing protein [Candidatus Dormibacteraeota bacterium]